MNGQMAGGGRGGGGSCSLLKSTVKIFDIYTEESEYIQAAKGEEDHLSLVRGTFGTAHIQPNPCTLSDSVLRNCYLYLYFTISPLLAHSCDTQGFEVANAKR
ncbi:hypothetical protein PAMP_004676 [Pampus punctatissimus]